KDPVNMLGYVADNLRTGRTDLVTWSSIGDIPDAVLLDVRSPAEFAGGSLPGAVNVPLDDLRDRLAEVRDLCAGTSGAGTQRPLVVFCQVGQRGHVAESLLRGEGFGPVYNLTGGYRTWCDGQSSLH
ncbi:rhodanese-like domain-containing protein, partial [Corynebacterium variabile]